MNKPLISILMPYKNTAGFLEACVNSIVDQHYPNWELLAVNDHSTDHNLADQGGRLLKVWD